jgi:hypothetical protein
VYISRARLHRGNDILTISTKRMEIFFILLFRYLRRLRSEHLKKVATVAAAKARVTLPVVAK